MSATLDQSSRPWWSMKANSAPAPEYPSEKPKSKSKGLNLFGRKYKKQTPSLAIPDPPLPIQNIPPEHTQSFSNRPPSKSVSSTHSRPDSLEPRTPSDVHHNSHHRHSLLTLSDADPFASPRNVSIISSPHLPMDPTRLSAYSNSSSGAGEISYAKNSQEQPRTSFASSSYSQNHTGGPESPVPPVLSPALPPTRKLLHKRSDTALNSNRGQQPSPHISITGTSGTLSSNAPSSRPLTRPRGLTDNGTLQKSGFFVDGLNFATASSSITAVASEPPPSTRPPSSRRPSNASSTRSPVITSPRVVVRQASVQGLSKPAPPPTQRLPAPPQSYGRSGDPSQVVIAHPPPPRRLHSNSSASSTVSFASCLDPDAFTTDAFPSPPTMPSPGRPRRLSDRSRPSNPNTVDIEKMQSAERSKYSLAPHTPPTLKKAVSHQSLLKRGPLFSASSSTQTSALTSNREQAKDADKEKEKTPHKLRIFPHPRIPLPPMPLKHSSSSTSTLIEPTPQEQKRVSAGSVRKRLFSGSSLRRPSTSHSVKDDDNQSIFSCKSEQDMYINTSFFKPWISTQSSGPSHWEEASPDTAPNSPTHGALLPDSFATIEPVSPILGRYEPTRAAPPLTFSSPTLTGAGRQRGFSVRSSSTVASLERDDESVLPGLSPRSYSNGQRFHRSNTFTTSPRPRAGSNVSQGGKAESVLSVHSISPRPRTATSASAPKKLSDRPSTAQPSLNTGAQLSSAAAVERAFSYAKPSESPPASMTSLPPPPRRNRPRPVIAPQVEEPAQTKPPPRKSPATSPLASPVIPPPSPPAVQIAGPLPPPTTISLQPPPRRAPRPKISFEKIIHRRSIMKKPSFLDFDNDDDDDDNDVLGGDLDVLGVGQKEDTIELFDEPRSRVPSMQSERSSSRRTSSRAPSSRTNSTRNSRGVADIKSPPTASESFLDLARESFDTTRDHF